MMRAAIVGSLATLLLCACGHGSPGGPTLDQHVAEPDDSAPAIQSNDILARDRVTKQSKVKHILISWKDLAATYDGHMDPRGAARTRAEADELATKLLARVRAGDPIEPLMAEFSEDPGSNQSGDSYDVSPDAQLVFEFKRLGLRLNVGEAGLVLTQFGWHIMKRIQ